MRQDLSVPQPALKESLDLSADEPFNPHPRNIHVIPGPLTHRAIKQPD